MLRFIIPYKGIKAKEVFFIFIKTVIFTSLTGAIFVILCIYIFRFIFHTKRLAACFIKTDRKSMFLCSEKNANHSPAALINDFLQGLLYLQLCINRHMHQLVG